MKGFRPYYRVRRVMLMTGVILSLAACHAVAATPDASPVDFDRDIRPILSDRCFRCHGPDAAQRQAGLRLDDQAAAFEEAESGETPFVPGDPDASELLRRVITDDVDERMPPEGEGKPLTKTEVAMLRQWIAEGANYKPHWAFIRPERPTPPDVAAHDWPQGAVDRFVMKRLEQEGLSPSPRADRRTLIRRLYLDLVGIPPTIDEVEAFVADSREGAYERLVDQLLASPHYGERMAQDWLDLARYSDTTGFAADSPRPMWLYRDWVIKALNDNMPFDQFTIEQLAGDMLPDATVEQRIATGFHRNSMQALGNNPRKEEFRVKGIVDRVNTTGRVWLGLTVSCAECHDHKFDPVSQAEYYGLFAIFNNVPHYGKAFGVRGPRIDARTPLAEQRQAQIEAELAGLKRQITPFESEEYVLRYVRWFLNARLQIFQPNRPRNETSIGPPLTSHWPLSGTLDDRSEKPSSAKLHGGDPSWIKGSGVTSEQSLQLSKKQYVRVAHHDKFAPSGDVPSGDGPSRGYPARGITVTAWIKTKSGKADIVCKWDSVRGQRSFVFGIGGEGEQNATPGHLYAWLSAKKEYFSGQQVYGSIPVNDDRWHHVAMVFHAGDRVDLYVDGERDRRVRRSGDAPETLAAATCDLIIGGGYSLKPDPSSYFFDGAISDVRILDGISEPAATLGAITPAIRSILAKDDGKRTDAERTQLRQFFDKLEPGQMTDEVRDRIATLDQELAFLARDHQAQVMLEMKEPRETHVHIRGNYLEPGKEVKAGVPAFLPPIDGETLANRLSFARWLVDPEHPLTARVAVNRIWQHYFGVGLVKTADDFGRQGDWPSHPDLLDWLAVEFVEGGWDVKALHRKIVTSATYRQSAIASPEAYRRDPLNRLLARGPRFRLPAEQIRDQALSVAGLLSKKLGGPSVHPVQPAGLFEEKGQTMYHPTWITSGNVERYRRGVYVYWKRMNLYPSMAIFDAPTRERCRVQRAATNTPLQALVLLNDPVYIEAARAFAKTVTDHSGDEATRIDFAIHRCLARPATRKETVRYGKFLTRQRKHYHARPDAATEWAFGKDGKQPQESAPNTKLADRAAWTTLASVLLNLDETITKP